MGKINLLDLELITTTFTGLLIKPLVGLFSKPCCTVFVVQLFCIIGKDVKLRKEHKKYLGGIDYGKI